MRVIHTVGGGLAAAALVLLAVSPVAGAEEPSRAELNQRLQRLENIINSGQLGDILQRLDTLAEEIRQLRGEVETQSHRLDELRQRQRNLYGDLDRRIRELEVASRRPGADEGGTAASGSAGSAGSAAAGAAAGSAAGAAAGTGSAAAGSSSGSGGDSGDAQPRDPKAERKAYDAAFQLLREGRYDQSADEFIAFLEQFPDGPYADNAQYWLGEARYVTRQFEPALTAFKTVVAQHPDSAKVPDARLKMGYTLYEMERYDEARQVLQTVTRQHPESAVARLAEDRLVRMKNEGH